MSKNKIKIKIKKNQAKSDVFGFIMIHAFFIYKQKNHLFLKTHREPVNIIFLLLPHGDFTFSLRSI